MPRDLRVYQFGEFELDAGEHQLLRRGAEVRLRPKAFDTLLCLVERHGHVVSKEELLDRVWSGTNVSEAVLTHCIAEVRHALEDEARQPRYLRTLSLAGYKFIAPVEAKAVAGHEATPGPDSHASAGGRAADEGRPPSLPAIAVLPFTNLSTDPENEYFCDGLAEELLNGLTRVRGLRVVARTSAFSFKGRDADVREIGRQLNTTSVLEGSVRKSGDRLRISAQLIDTRDGYHVWSEQYERRLEDVFLVQDEISRAIVSRLAAGVQDADRRSLVPSPTRNMDAYRLYAKGRAFWHRRFHGGLATAMGCFQRAIDLDPQFALAYSGLADCHTTLGIFAFVRPEEAFTSATALANTALELEPALAEAHASRAMVAAFYEWDWTLAARELARAVDLAPGNALIHLWNGHYNSIVGRWEEAIREVRLAQDLDPLSPVVVANVGWTFSLAGQQERAIEELQKVLAIDPTNALALFYLCYAYGEAGRYDEALESVRKAIAVTGGMPWAAEFAGWVYGLSGDHEKARAVLGETLAQMGKRYIPSSGIAVMYLGLGEDNEALTWLERCVDERDALMPWIKFLPCLDRLRSHPRFESVLARVGLATSPDAPAI